MNRLFSEKEIKKLKNFINKKPLNEQKWLDDIITAAKNLDNSKNLYSRYKNKFKNGR